MATNNELLLRVNVQTGQAIGQLNTLNQNITGLTGSVNNFTTSFTRNVTAAQLVATGLTKVLSVSKELASQNFNNFLKLESTLTNISNLSDKAIINMKGYSNSLLQLSSDIGLSATETASGIQKLLQAGITNQKEAATLLSKLQQFAIATGSTIDDVQNTILVLRANFKLTGDDIDTALSQIAVAAARSRLDISDFAAQFGELAGVMRPAGISLNEGAGFFALLADKLSTASEAAVSFKALVGKLGNPTGDMQHWLDAVNKSMGTSLVFSPTAITKAGGFEPFMKNFLTTLQAYADKNKFAVADILAKMFEEVKSSRGLQGVVDEIVKGTNFKSLEHEIVNNTEFLKKSYESVSKTLKVQFESLGISVNNIFMNFFVKNRDLIQSGLDNFVYFSNSIAKVFKYIGQDLLSGLGNYFVEFNNSRVMTSPFKTLLDTVLGVFLTIYDNAKRIGTMIAYPFQHAFALIRVGIDKIFNEAMMIGKTIKNPSSYAQNKKELEDLTNIIDKQERKRELSNRDDAYRAYMEFGQVTIFDPNKEIDLFNTKLKPYSLSPKAKLIGKGKPLDTIALPSDLTKPTSNKTQQNKILKEQKDFLDQRLKDIDNYIQKEFDINNRRNSQIELSEVEQAKKEYFIINTKLALLNNLKTQYAKKDKELQDKINNEIIKTTQEKYNKQTDIIKANKDRIYNLIDEETKKINESFQARQDFLLKINQDINQSTVQNQGLSFTSSILLGFGFDTSILNTSLSNMDKMKSKILEVKDAIKKDNITFMEGDSLLNQFKSNENTKAMLEMIPTIIKNISNSLDQFSNVMGKTNNLQKITRDYFFDWLKVIPVVGDVLSKLSRNISDILGTTKNELQTQKDLSILDQTLNYQKELNRKWIDNDIERQKADLDIEYQTNIEKLKVTENYEEQKVLLELKYQNDKEDLRKQELKTIQDYNDKQYNIEKKTIDDTYTKKKESLDNEVSNIKNSLKEIDKAYQDLTSSREEEQNAKQSIKARFLSSLSARGANVTADFYRQTQTEADLFFSNSEASINRLFNIGDISTQERMSKQQSLAIDKYLYYQSQLAKTQSPEAKAKLQEQMDQAQEKYYEYAIDKERDALDKKQAALKKELEIKLTNLQIAEQEETDIINRLNQKYKDLAGNYRDYMINANTEWINKSFNNSTRTSSGFQPTSIVSNPLNSVGNVSGSTVNSSVIDALRSTYGMSREQFNNSFGSYSNDRLLALAQAQGIPIYNNTTSTNNSNPLNFTPVININQVSGDAQTTANTVKKELSNFYRTVVSV